MQEIGSIVKEQYSEKRKDLKKGLVVLLELKTVIEIENLMGEKHHVRNSRR